MVSIYVCTNFILFRYSIFVSDKINIFLGDALPISADPGLHNLLFTTPMDAVTGQILRDPVTNKKMGRRVTNGDYQYHIRTDYNKRKVEKRLGALETVHVALSKLTIRSSSIEPIMEHIRLCTVSNTVMKINDELLNENSIYIQFCKKSQNWCKSMRLRHHIKSASFLDKKLWQICHVDGMSTKIHMYYGGAHVNSTMRGCKHAAPTIRTKSTIYRFVSAVVEVNEFRTSQVCFDCNERTHSVRSNNGKNIRGLLFCGSDTCKSCRYKDRDENGAKNIYKVSNDAVPDIFSRRVSWKNSKRLVHYLNIQSKIAKRGQLCENDETNKKPRHGTIAQDELDSVMET